MNTTGNGSLARFGAQHFDWTEYAVFSLMLGISLLIGIYFGFLKKQTTVKEYLLGNKDMGLWPVSLSLIASYVTCLAFVSVPTEIYMYGTPYCLSLISNFTACLINLVVFLPVFYKLQLISIFEYLELRFSHPVRIFTSALYTLMIVCYMPVNIYGPAISLNQVTGVNLYLVVIVLSAICIFYTTVGGLKAVVWSDAVQCLIMMTSVIVVAILGINRVGGIAPVFEAASKGDRLEFFNFDPDPRARLTVWTAVLGITMIWAGFISVQPGFVQRFLALPTYREAQWSIFFLALGICLLQIPCMFIGLVLYAIYKDCDPLSAKLIDKPDQIMSLYVLDVAGNIKGLSALFLVGLCSASLSTISTSLNSLSGTLYEDFIVKMFKRKPSDAKSSFIIKSLVLFIGVFSTCLVPLVERLGSIVEISSGVLGIILGSTMGIFSLGILFPTANNKGAIVGGLLSLVTTSWLMVANHLARERGYIQYPPKPISTAGCPSNLTLVPEGPTKSFDEDVSLLYQISFFYYGLVGTATAIICGLITSHLTGPLKMGQVHPDLLCPLLHRFIPKNSYTMVPLRETEEDSTEFTKKNENEDS